jgi:hypothetical protein
LLDTHEAALLEQFHPLPNDGTAEPEVLAERRLRRQDVTLSERAADDLVRELFDHHGSQTPWPPRRSSVAGEMERRTERRTFLAH